MGLNTDVKNVSGLHECNGNPIIVLKYLLYHTFDKGQSLMEKAPDYLPNIICENGKILQKQSFQFMFLTLRFRFFS